MADAFRWSTEAPIGRAAVLSAGIGMAGPVALAAAVGDLPSGYAAALGSLMVAGSGAARAPVPRATQLAVGLGPAVAAAVLAAVVAGHGRLGDMAVVLLAGAAALLGGISRPAAAATARFVPFLVIAATVAETTPTRGGFAALMLAGVLWTVVVRAILGRIGLGSVRPAQAAPDASPPRPSAKQAFTRWRRSLARTSGWQFAARLTVCLIVATALRWHWPGHHLHWIALTVALLIERPVETLPVKTTQRALGTALGVAAMGGLVAYSPPVWGQIAGIAVLAGARPVLRARNYIAYAAAMTPLIMTILDAGQPFEFDVLIDRLVATLVGAGLVIVANLVAGKVLPATAGAQAPVSSPSTRT